MSPRVVALDARYAFHPEQRGIGRYVQGLVSSRALAEAPFTFLLYVDAGAQLPAALPPNMHTVRLPCRDPLQFELWAMPRAVRRDGAELVHYTANYGWPLSRVPAVLTVYDVIDWLRPGLPGGVYSWRLGTALMVRRPLLRHLVRTPVVRALITVSEFSRGDLVRHLGAAPERITVIPPGIEEVFCPASSPEEARERARRDGLPVPERYILCLGARDPRKNTALAVASLGRVRAELPRLELVVAGHRDPAWQRPGVRQVGFVRLEQLVWLYQGAEAFLYLSGYEGFGLPVLEAMACGTPVVAARATSLPEVGGDVPFYVEDLEPEGVARAVVEACTAPDRQDRIARGLRRAAAFRWEAAARATLAVYRRVLGLEG